MAYPWLDLTALIAASADSAVREAAKSAQVSVDAVYAARSIMRPGPTTPALIAHLRAQELHACASLAGAPVPWSTFAAVRADGSPISLAIALVEQVHSAGRSDATMFLATAPRALARWHVLATASTVPRPTDAEREVVLSDERRHAHLADGEAPRYSAPLTHADEGRGRPRLLGEVVSDDALNCGIDSAPAAEVIASVMNVVGRSDIEAMTRAAAVHALLAAGQPFGQSNALLGRTAATAVLVATAADVDALVPWQSQLLSQGRPDYVAELRALAAAGEPVAGWIRWLMWHATVLQRAADMAVDLVGA